MLQYTLCQIERPFEFYTAQGIAGITSNFWLVSGKNHAKLTRVFNFATRASRVFSFPRRVPDACFQFCDAWVTRVFDFEFRVKGKGRERKGRERNIRTSRTERGGGGGRDLDERRKADQSISLLKNIAMGDLPTHTYSLTHTHGIPKDLPTSILVAFKGHLRISS